MKALITGVNGFVGSFLSTMLLEQNIEVIGVDRVAKEGGPFSQYSADVNNLSIMGKIIQDIQPDQIYHLAAPAFIPDSYTNPKGTFDVIITGTVNILETIRQVSPYSKLLYVGSSDEYGVHNNKEAFKETMLPEPCTPYAAAKLSASIICGQYARFYDVNVVRTRSFNHIGPKQSPRFACASMARQIAEVENSGKHEIVVGNLDTGRDFLDVRDVVRAYYMIMAIESAGQIFNVCSGRSIQIHDILDKMLALSSLGQRKNLDIRVESQHRKFDSITMLGSNQKLKEHTGWEPIYQLEQTLLETLNYWRENV